MRIEIYYVRSYIRQENKYPNLYLLRILWKLGLQFEIDGVVTLSYNNLDPIQKYKPINFKQCPY